MFKNEIFAAKTHIFKISCYVKSTSENYSILKIDYINIIKFGESVRPEFCPILIQWALNAFELLRLNFTLFFSIL